MIEIAFTEDELARLEDCLLAGCIKYRENGYTNQEAEATILIERVQEAQQMQKDIDAL